MLLIPSLIILIISIPPRLTTVTPRTGISRSIPMRPNPALNRTLLILVIALFAFNVFRLYREFVREKEPPDYYVEAYDLIKKGMPIGYVDQLLGKDGRTGQVVVVQNWP